MNIFKVKLKLKSTRFSKSVLCFKNIITQAKTNVVWIRVLPTEIPKVFFASQQHLKEVSKFSQTSFQ